MSLLLCYLQLLQTINDKFKNYKIIRKSGNQSHKSDFMYNREEKFRQKKILTEIQNDPTKPVTMIYDEQVKLNSEIENSRGDHKISIGLLRKRIRNSPKIARILLNVKIDGMWSKTSDNQDFVLAQRQFSHRQFSRFKIQTIQPKKLRQFSQRQFGRFRLKRQDKREQ